MESDRETSYQCPVIYLLSWKVREGAVLELLGARCNAWLGTGQEKREEAISNSSCLYDFMESMDLPPGSSSSAFAMESPACL